MEKEIKKETVEEKPKKKSKWWEKMLNIVGIIFLLFCIFLAYGFGINNRFYKLLVVTSGSMSPVFEAGDVIFVVRMDPTTAKVGNIVTFQTKDNEILTHRIVEIKDDGEIITKGDANNTNDSWNDGLKLGKVETKYIFKIPKLGYAIFWLRGLFPAGMNTGAWLSDTQKTRIGLEAGQWEVPEQSPSESVEPTESTSPPTG